MEEDSRKMQEQALVKVVEVLSTKLDLFFTALSSFDYKTASLLLHEKSSVSRLQLWAVCLYGTIMVIIGCNTAIESVN